LAADDDLIRLCPVEITAGLSELAEEVADEPLGTLIQVLEVGGKLGVSVSTKKRKRSDADLKSGIGGKREVSYPRRGRSAGGTFADTLVASHLLGGRREAGVLEELKEEECKEHY